MPITCVILLNSDFSCLHNGAVDGDQKCQSSRVSVRMRDISQIIFVSYYLRSSSIASLNLCLYVEPGLDTRMYVLLYLLVIDVSVASSETHRSSAVK